MFYDEIKKYDWNDTTRCIASKTARDVEIALGKEQIEKECQAIRQLGPFENLLIVTGEHPAKAGVDYLERALQTCRPYFNNLTIEVMPLKAEAYYRLTQSGLNGVVCFQETYNEANYKKYHPRGMKSIYDWRLNGPYGPGRSP